MGWLGGIAESHRGPRWARQHFAVQAVMVGELLSWSSPGWSEELTDACKTRAGASSDWRAEEPPTRMRQPRAVSLHIDPTLTRVPLTGVKLPNPVQVW